MDENQQIDTTTSEEPKSGGGFVGNLIISMLFPFMALWHGPKYIIEGEYVKGIAILVIVGIELFFAFRMQGII